MNVFNSLGSNYSLWQVLHSLYARGNRVSVQEFTQELAGYYGGQVQLTYKGRQALEIALKRAGLPPGSQVAINGFTCFVVYQAVRNAGYEPVMVDVGPGELDFGLDQLQTAHSQAPNLRALIVQNTLGLPVDMKALEQYCREHNLLIIEDLAHSLGTIYSDGREAGTVGDLIMLSFSQDKPLDVVAGGACIDRRPTPPKAVKLPSMSLRQGCINRLYPVLTMSIRGLYPLGLGRVLHAGLKKLHLLATPMSDNVQGLNAMTSMSKGLLPSLWRERATVLLHRQRIAAIYQQMLPEMLQYRANQSGATFLRFPLRVPERAGLVAYLKSHHIYIGDTWYDAPIAPKRYLSQTNYQPGQCPQAEQLATQIINLPTHRHVTEARAKFIAEKVQEWLTQQTSK